MNNAVLLLTLSVLASSISCYYNDKVVEFAQIEDDGERCQKQKKAVKAVESWTVVTGVTVVLHFWLVFIGRQG